MFFSKFQSNSVKTRVTLFTLAIFLVSIWSLTFYARQLLHQDIQVLLGEQQFSTVSLIATELDHELSERLDALKMVAAATSPTLLGSPAALQKSLEGRPVFRELFNGGAFATGLDGVAIASVPLAAQRHGVEYLDRDYIAAAIREGRAAIGRPVIGRRVPAPIIGMAAPIRDANGTVVGAIAGVINLGARNFLDNLLSIGYGRTGAYLVIAPQNRQIVTASEKRRAMELLPAAGISPTLDRFIQGHEGTEIFINPLGVEVLASVKGVPTAGWYVAGMLPTTEVFGPIRHMQQRLLLATLFLTLLAGSLTWWMLRRQLAPLQATAKTLAALSDENQTVHPLPVTRQDEIGQVISGFNRLVGTLRQRELALKAREERFRILFDRASDGIMIVSTKGRLLAVNESFAQMHGYSTEEILALDLKALDTPESSQRVPERLQRIKSAGAATFEVEHFHKDGHTFPLEVSASLMLVDGESVIQSFHRDITERRQNEARLTLLAHRSEVLLKLPAAADARDEQSFLQYGLALAEQLTGSQIAFAHFVLDDQETIELLTWSQDTLAHYCQASVSRHCPISQAGIWADALRQRAPVLVNDYASAPGRHGLPEGHARLDRLISVPVIEGGLVRMMVGMGNKPQPYTELDVETTRLIADALWRIVHQRRADSAMRKSQKSLREAQFIAGLGSYVLDISSGRWESSEALDSLFGIDANYERSVQGWQALIHRDDLAMMEEHLRNQVLLQHQPFDKEYRITRQGDMAQRWVHGLGRLEFDPQGQARQLRGTVQDITQRKAVEEQIKSLVFSDPLTGLPNRRFLMDRIEKAMAGSLRHHLQGALLLIDLDNFKTLNDTLGHHQGDLVLHQVANRLTRCVRETDTVARLGGDEFVVLLEDLSQAAQEAATQAKTVGDKILAALNQPHLLGTSAHHSSASIGITLFGDQSESIDDPLKRADLAMYQAKLAGQNALRFFDPQMQAVVNARAALELGLREAIAKGQFVLHYQAQVTDERQVIGAEALVRWLDPRRGMVSPAEFIPLAEETGLILPLGNWVLETACTQLAQWAGKPGMAHLSMAVNVSPRQFHQEDFVGRVLAVLARTGAKPSRLKLELTESVLISNIEDVIAKMNALKARGVGFSLDDFGTGYSSLSYLKRLPLDQLKIDQAFVRDILIDPNDAAIARMVVALADSLGLTVIPEGVETEAQRDFLAALGCHNYQGYLFGRPLPIDEFEAFVQNGNAGASAA